VEIVVTAALPAQIVLARARIALDFHVRRHLSGFAQTQGITCPSPARARDVRAFYRRQPPKGCNMRA
jgi:hypothetical protein